MTKINHRAGTTPRRTTQSFEQRRLSEIAYLDAAAHIAAASPADPAYRGGNVHHALRYGRHVQLRQFVYHTNKPARKEG